MSDHSAAIDALIHVFFALAADGEVSTMSFLGQEFKKVRAKS